MISRPGGCADRRRERPDRAQPRRVSRESVRATRGEEFSFTGSRPRLGRRCLSRVLAFDRARFRWNVVMNTPISSCPAATRRAMRSRAVGSPLRGGVRSESGRGRRARAGARRRPATAPARQRPPDQRSPLARLSAPGLTRPASRGLPDSCTIATAWGLTVSLRPGAAPRRISSARSRRSARTRAAQVVQRSRAQWAARKGLENFARRVAARNQLARGIAASPSARHASNAAEAGAMGPMRAHGHEQDATAHVIGPGARRSLTPAHAQVAHGSPPGGCARA